MDDKTKMTRTTHIFHQPVHFSFALALLLSQPPKVPQNVKPEFCMCFTDLWVREKKEFSSVTPQWPPGKKGAKSPKGHTLLVTFALSSANFRPRIAARAIFERSGGDATMSTEYFFAKRWTTPFIFLLRHTITIIEVLTFLRNKTCKASVPSAVQNWQRHGKSN